MQTSIEERENDLTSPYQIFKFSIRSELTRKYYERRIRRFFDFIEFNPGKDIELRCNDFALKARSDAGWVLNKIITFLQFQKERTEKGEITPATFYQKFYKYMTKDTFINMSRATPDNFQFSVKRFQRQ